MKYKRAISIYNNSDTSINGARSKPKRDECVKLYHESAKVIYEHTGKYPIDYDPNLNVTITYHYLLGNGKITSTKTKPFIKQLIKWHTNAKANK